VYIGGQERGLGSLKAASRRLTRYLIQNIQKNSTLVTLISIRSLLFVNTYSTYNIIEIFIKSVIFS